MFLEVTTSLIFVWFIWYILSTYQERKRMPPGPFPFPLIGNLPQLGSDPLDSFGKLVEKYGDIFTISFPHGNFVVINNAALMREARLSRKDDLAGRLPKYLYPLNVIFGERDVLTTTFGSAYMFRKKVFKSALHVFGAGIEKAEKRVGHAVTNLLNEIEAMESRSFSPKRLVASAIISQLWEWITSKKCSLNHPTVKSFLEFNEKIANLSAQGSIYQLIPWLSFLPTTFNRKLREVINTREEVFSPELQAHRETYMSGVIRDLTDAFVSAYEKEIAKETGKDIGSIEDIKFLMFDVEFGGSDTTSSSLTWFILYMALHQDVQQKIHEDLDRVVGKDRLPCWQDVTSMSYLQATLCEVLRHSRVTPVLLTTTIRDTTLSGYHIPKHTGAFINLSQIHRDQREWPEPDAFKPNRFLDADGKFIGWTKLHGFMPFAIGHRECPGQALAKITLFLFASALMYRFKFEFAEGQPRPTLEPAGPAMVLCPKDYQIVAKKRM